MAKWRRKADEKRPDPGARLVLLALALSLLLFGLVSVYFLSHQDQIPPLQSRYVKGG